MLLFSPCLYLCVHSSFSSAVNHIYRKWLSRNSMVNQGPITGVFGLAKFPRICAVILRFSLPSLQATRVGVLVVGRRSGRPQCKRFTVFMYNFCPKNIRVLTMLKWFALTSLTPTRGHPTPHSLPLTTVCFLWAEKRGGPPVQTMPLTLFMYNF